MGRTKEGSSSLGPRACPPGLEPTHASLQPGQEAEAPAGDAGTEATTKGEQGLGAPLGPESLQLPPALLLQQDLWAGVLLQMGRGRGRGVPALP